METKQKQGRDMTINDGDWMRLISQVDTALDGVLGYNLTRGQARIDIFEAIRQYVKGNK